MKKGADDPERNAMALAMLGNPTNMVRDFDKPAGARCQHQRHTGCAIYDKRPMGCRLWSCRWLTEDDTAELRRPDRSGYVIDIMPDFIRYVPKEDGGEGTPVQVVQIWIDPKRRNDWRDDPALWRYLERRAAQNIAAILRFSSYEALIIIAPAMAEDGQWHEVPGGNVVTERSTWPGQLMQPIHSAQEKEEADGSP
jgi:hypothetical protein